MSDALYASSLLKSHRIVAGGAGEGVKAVGRAEGVGGDSGGGDNHCFARKEDPGTGL